MTFRRVPCMVLGLAACPLAFAPYDAHAQNFPERPIRLIVAHPPGGSTDLLARLVGPRLSEVWQQPVIIDNPPPFRT